MLRRNSGSRDLKVVRLRQVQQVFCSYRVPIRKIRRELLGEVLSHFVTAIADAGPHCRVYIARLSPEIGAHFFDGLPDDLGKSTPPTSVHSGHRTRPGIDQQNGNAICRADSDTLPNIIRDQRIAFAFAILQTVRVKYAIGVNLPERDIGTGAAKTRAESVLLPHELLKGIAPVNTVAREPE